MKSFKILKQVARILSSSQKIRKIKNNKWGVLTRAWRGGSESFPKRNKRSVGPFIRDLRVGCVANTTYFLESLLLRSLIFLHLEISI